MKKIFAKLAMCMTLICSVITLTSCTEKDEIIQNSFNEVKSISDGYLPFDYIGEQHNAYLYAIGETFQDILDAYATMAEQDELDAEMQERLALRIIDELPLIEQEYKILGVSNDTLHTYISIACSQFNMDSLDNSFFYSDLGVAVKHVLENIEKSTNVNEQRQFIRIKEEEILKNATCILDTCVVITLNVFEHSLIFWNDAYENINNPWHKYLITTDKLKLDVTFNTKSNVLQSIGSFFVKLKNKVVETFEKIFNPSKITQLALVDGVSCGATAYWLAHTPFATQPGVVLGGALLSGVFTSAGCGVLNWNTL